MKLYRRNEIWWVEHYDAATKKKIRASTKETDYNAAKKVMLEQFAPIFAAEADARLAVATGISKRQREKLAETKPSAIRLANLEVPPKLANVRNTRFALGRVKRYCLSHGVTTVAQLTDEVMSAACDGLKRNTENDYRLNMRLILTALGVAKNEMRFASTAGRENDIEHHQPLSKDEIKKLLATVDDYDLPFDGLAALVRVMLYTGLRVSDACLLTAADVDVKRKVITRKMQKTKSVVEFPIHRALLPHLPQVKSGYLFPVMAQKYKSRAIFHIIHRLFYHAKVNGSAHCLRATFATLAVENNVPLYLVQSWLGHTSEMVTRIYAHFEDMQKKAEAVAKLPDFG